ncbi:MAG: hypothetical protein AAFQ82_24080 [Myxococcota bacterium]
MIIRDMFVPAERRHQPTRQNPSPEGTSHRLEMNRGGYETASSYSAATTPEAPVAKRVARPTPVREQSMTGAILSGVRMGTTSTLVAVRKHPGRAVVAGAGSVALLWLAPGAFAALATVGFVVGAFRAAQHFLRGANKIATGDWDGAKGDARALGAAGGRVMAGWIGGNVSRVSGVAQTGLSLLRTLRNRVFRRES